MPWDTPGSSCLDQGVATLRCIPVVFNNLIRAALIFVGVVALFFFMLSGFNFVTSGGDPKKIQGAKQTLTFAIVGLLIVLFSFAIIFFIGYVTGTEKCIANFTDITKLLTGCST